MLQVDAGHIGLQSRKSGLTLTLYRPTFPVEVFAEVADMLEASLMHCDEMNIQHLYKTLKGGHGHLWVLYGEGGEPLLAMVTCFVEYPLTKHLHALALGGKNVLRAKPFWPVMEEFLRFNYCSKFTAAVRPQFMKILEKRFGFTHMYSYVSRSVMEAASGTQH